MSQVYDTPTQVVEDGIYNAERKTQDTTGFAQAAVDGSLKQEAIVKAKEVQSVAQDAADTAKAEHPETTGEFGSAVGALEKGLKETTDAAAAEGQANVNSVKDTTTSYLNQATTIAGTALATAQSTASSALETTKTVLASAQAIIAPQVQNALNAAQPNVAKARAAVAPHINSAMQTVQPTVSNAYEAAQGVVQSAQDTVQPRVKAAVDAAQPHINKASELFQTEQNEKPVDPAREV